jgi:hypothetical protein
MVSIIDKHATGDQLMRVPVTPRLDTSTESGEVEDFDADVDAQEDADVTPMRRRRRTGRRAGRRRERRRSRSRSCLSAKST